MNQTASKLWNRLQDGWSTFMTSPPLRAISRHWREDYGILLVTVGAAIVAYKFIDMPGKAPDFTVFWAAATHAFGPVYDSDFVSPLQNGPPGPRPFANPPTFLLLLLPLGVLNFKAAYVAWVSMSVATYFATGLRLTKLVWLAIFSPTLIFVALIGQTTLLAGSLAVLGLTVARRKPIYAGLALGVAACIKPQLVILAPLALLLLQDVRATFVAGVTALMLALATTLVFGFGIWRDWLQSLTGFQAITSKLAIGQLSLPPSGSILICGAVVIVALMVLAARNGDRPRLVVSTIGGSLLLAPYAAHYESVVLLLPSLALLRLDWRILPIGFLLSGSAVTTLPFAVVVALLAMPARRPEMRALSIRAS
jgi:hypothetical protein